MKVILLKSVPKLGKKDDVVEVSHGYAQNALFPRKLAIPANDSSVSDLNRRKQNIVVENEIKKELLDKAIKSLNESKISMAVPANDQGSLFSKIHEEDIVEFLLKNHRISIDTKFITLPDGPIKRVGDYELKIVDGDYKTKLNLNIIKK